MRDPRKSFRGGVAIGDQIIDLCALADAQLFSGEAAEGVSAGSKDSLNALMRLGPRVWSALRRALFRGHGARIRARSAC